MCQRTGTYLKMRISLQLCKKKNGFDTYYHFFLQRNSYHLLQRLSSQTCYLNSFLKKSEFFFSNRFIYIYVCMDKLLKGEREKT